MKRIEINKMANELLDQLAEQMPADVRRKVLTAALRLQAEEKVETQDDPEAA